LIFPLAIFFPERRLGKTLLATTVINVRAICALQGRVSLEEVPSFGESERVATVYG